MELECHIRLLHRAVGNAVTGDRFIIFGSGSTQLLNAVIKAFSSPLDHNSPVGVVAAAPYYEVSRGDRNFSWDHEWRPFMIMPTTGLSTVQFQLQLMKMSCSSSIPSSQAMPAPDLGKYLPMDLSTVGVSSDTQLRVLKLIKTILLEIREEGDFFKFGYEIMKERWQRLSKVVSSSNRFSLQKLSPHYCNYFNEFKDPSPAYAWLRCEKDEDEDCEAVLRNAGILSRGGTVFEAHSRYARLSLIKTLDDFEQLLQKPYVIDTCQPQKQMRGAELFSLRAPK